MPEGLYPTYNFNLDNALALSPGGINCIEGQLRFLYKAIPAIASHCHDWRHRRQNRVCVRYLIALRAVPLIAPCVKLSLMTLGQLSSTQPLGEYRPGVLTMWKLALQLLMSIFPISRWT